MFTKKSRAIKQLEAIIGHEMTFGDMLESFRICNEMSQVEMARKLGISRAQLCDIEKGRRSVSAETAAKFAKKLRHSERVFVRLAIQDQLRRVGLKMRVEVHAA